MSFDNPEKIKEKVPEIKPEEEQNPFKPIQEISEKRGLKILVYGDSGSGKTYLGLTGNAPIAVIDTERGTSPLKNNFVDKIINVCEINFKGSERNVMENDEVKAFQNMASAVNFLTQQENKPKTILFDSVSDLWSYAQSYGKVKIFKLSPEDRIKFRFDWGKINNLHKRIINRLISCDSDVIFTARNQEEYDSAGNPMGNFKPQCQKNLPYDVDIIIEIRAKFIKTQTGVNKTRIFRIHKCRQKGDIEKKEYENLTIKKLQELIKEEESK